MMENISHVNRYFFLKIPFWPLLFVNFLFKYIRCKNLAKKYYSGSLELSLETRYARIFSLFKGSISLKNLSYSFLLKEKLLQTQTVFIINESFSWNTLALVKKLSETKIHFYPSIFFSFSTPISKYSIWNLIDGFYGNEDFEKAISSKKSFLIESSLIKKFPKFLYLLQANRIVIVPIYRNKSGFCIRYVIGKPIKTSNMINFKIEAIYSSVFASLEKLIHDLKFFNKKNIYSKFKPKDLFSIR